MTSNECGPRTAGEQGRVALVVDPVYTGDDRFWWPTGDGGRWQTISCADERSARRHLLRSAPDLVVVVQGHIGGSATSTLAATRRLRPQALRVVAVAPGSPPDHRLVSLAHRAVGLPLDDHDLAGLAEVVERVVDLVTSPSVRASVGALDGLPALPHSVFELQRCIEDERSDARRVADVLGSDAALAARVLQLVNSPFIGFARRVSDLAEAVAILGLREIRTLTLTAGIFRMLETGGDQDHQIRLHAHAAETAAVAAGLAGPLVRADAYCAGLLHVVGDLALDRLGLGAAVREECAASDRDLLDVERSQVGATHAQIGAMLLLEWGLPLNVVDAVAHHHTPQRADPHAVRSGLEVADVVHEACSSTAGLLDGEVADERAPSRI